VDAGQISTTGESYSDEHMVFCSNDELESTSNTGGKLFYLAKNFQTILARQKLHFLRHFEEGLCTYMNIVVGECLPGAFLVRLHPVFVI
jgi:hypothetical protein